MFIPIETHIYTFVYMYTYIYICTYIYETLQSSNVLKLISCAIYSRNLL